MAENSVRMSVQEFHNKRGYIQNMLAQQDRVNIIVVLFILFIILFEQLTYGIYLGLMYVKYPG